jgi:trehalose-phosphatase
LLMRELPSDLELAIPTLMPHGFLVQLARGSKLLLCLDYDGTLSDLTPDPSRAFPVDGIRESLIRLVDASNYLTIAIVTGRTVAQARHLLGVSDGLIFSGLHGLEMLQQGRIRVAPEAAAPASELDLVRRWIARNVPTSQGFHVEDKRFAVGIHYRCADPLIASAIADSFVQFVAASAPALKVMRLKMLVEAIPRVASKANAVAALRRTVKHPCVTVFVGDDATDEEALAALDDGDVGVLVGPARPSRARYRLPSPAAVTAELRALAEYFEHA